MIVKFGLDVHAAQITVCRQIEDQLPQPAHKMSWPRCLEWLEAHAKAGATVHSCYEAGPFGYHLHRTLEQLGIKNLVIAPQRWDERGQRVKTDKRDARELCNRLDRYVRGNTAVFSVVRVPTPQQERERSLARQRVALIKERQRCALRGHSLTLAQGIRAPEGWWQPEAWREFAPALPRWLRERLQWWQEQAVRHDAQAAEVTARIEALATNTPVPKGVGTLTATLTAAGAAGLESVQEPPAGQQLHRLVPRRSFFRRAPLPGLDQQMRPPARASFAHRSGVAFAVLATRLRTGAQAARRPRRAQPQTHGRGPSPPARRGPVAHPYRPV